MTSKIRVTRVITTGLAGAALALLVACSPTANEGTVSDATNNPAPGQQTGGKPANEAPTWGKRYTWADGLAVEVSAPAECKPSEVAYPQDIARAVKFTVTVVNGSDKPFEVALFTGDAQFGGKKAEQIVDIEGPCGDGLDTGTVLPGKTFTYDVSFSVGEAAGEMQLTFVPTIGGDRAVYVGQA